MTQPTSRDVELLSTYLDGELPKGDSTRLESRLAADPELASAYRDLRQSRALLRGLPQRRAPRRFTLSPKMAGVRPPLPRSYPVLRFASGLAAALFFITFLGNFFVSPPAQETAFNAAAPADMVATEAPTEAAPLVPALPTETATPARGAGIAPTEPPVAGLTAEAKAPASPTFAGWQAALLGLAVVLGGSALLIRWRADRDFRRRGSRGSPER